MAQLYVGRTLAEMKAETTRMGSSPQDGGTVAMIVSRPAKGERAVLQQAELDTQKGLIGDNWFARGGDKALNDPEYIGRQIAIINSRVIEAISPDRERWQLAGDQLIVDLDLSLENLPVGQQIAIGSAVLEITEVPHNGCKVFAERFGADATRFVNSKAGKQLRRRGVNARVVQSGSIAVGDAVTKR